MGFYFDMATIDSDRITEVSACGTGRSPEQIGG